MQQDFQATEQFALKLDQQDPLAKYRGYFFGPADQIYLDGNSLGLLSGPAEKALAEAVDQWKELAIGGWLDGTPAWFDLAEQLGARIAPLIGASPESVVVANSTTVNLHQLLATFYDPTKDRTVILADDLCFPTDRYAIESFVTLIGKDTDSVTRFAGQQGDWSLSEDQLIEAMTEDVQLVVLPSVVYTSGQLLDIPRLTQAAHARGAIIGFDCSHSVGAIPHHLEEHDVDFAFFCTYKYLNGGPGSPAAIFLNQRHFGRRAGLAGWFGCDKNRQFDMSHEFHQANNAGGLQMGTPPILSASPLRGSLDLVEQMGIEAIRAKSLKLTDYLRKLLLEKLAEHDFRCVTPTQDAARGGHLAIAIAEARGLSAALRSNGVLTDFRPPNLLRLAPAAPYTSFSDCYKAVEILAQILRDGLQSTAVQGDDRVP